MVDHGRDKDLLGRRALAGALADKLYGHAVAARNGDSGPTVVTIEGPWGSGKSTLLDLVRDGLPHPETSAAAPTRLTVRNASGLLRNAPVPEVVERAGQRGVVTAWFNPWAHQSGEQVWAGLVAEIIEAARPVLYPTEAARERYWLGRNLTRVDRYALRRTLHRRMLSPALTLGALGVVASLVIAVAELETIVDVGTLHIPTALMALMIASTFLLLGALHTGWRYARGSAARFLPGELFHGPVALAPDVEAAGAGRSDGLTDPLRRARAGALYLHQHDVSELVADLDRAGYELIVFVDDLDRCRALTTAEVFEAINLFLAGFVSERRATGRAKPEDSAYGLRARFVIGLDPVVVAGHLDKVYEDLYDPDTALDGEDPSPGWAFLRKLVHLPVLVPQVSDDEIFRIVDRITGNATESSTKESRATESRATESRATDGDATGSRATYGGATDRAASPGEPGSWRLRWEPRIQALVRARLAAQPDRSIREATRQLNVWELYERVLATTAGEADEDRTRRLIILAEIVTRWPALQRFLHRRTGTRTGLQLLAAAAGGPEDGWDRAVSTVFGRASPDEALGTLRELLREHDGVGVADLAVDLL